MCIAFANSLKRLKRDSQGLTFIELMVVIAAIAILSTIGFTTFNGMIAKAHESRQNADMTLLVKAITMARINTGQTLNKITDSNCGQCYCRLEAHNPDGTPPHELPKSHICWTKYEQALTNISAAAGVDLSRLRDGDTTGSPYAIDENEGEDPYDPCTPDRIAAFMPQGVDLVYPVVEVPTWMPQCRRGDSP